MRSACCRQNSDHGLPSGSAPASSSDELVGALGTVEQRREDPRRIVSGVGRIELAGPSAARCRACPFSASARSRESSPIGTRSSSDSSATVAGRGRAEEAAAWLLRSCSPRIRFSDSDSAGELCSSSSKCCLPIINRSLARAARTDADRGELVSSASSPSASPRPSSRTTTPELPLTTSRRPARTRYMASPGSPSWNSHSPAASRTGCERSASWSRRAGVRSANSGERARNCDGSSGAGEPAGGAPSTLIARRARGREGGGASPEGLRSTSRAASPSEGASVTTRPVNRHPMPAVNRHAAANRHASWNTSSACSGDGVPMIATITATPSAAPTWRETEFSPVAVAKLSPGAEATATPERLGNRMPAPIPSSTIPGSHSPRKSGCTPTRSTSHSTAPPQISPPAHSTGR